jgi:HEPN domain-containing protein
MPSNDDALMLFRKADEDIRVAELLASGSEFSDEMFGFHLQQAVEKLLKSLLAAQGHPYPFSHNLYELVDACREKTIDVPADVDGLCLLTPFATVLRYSSVPVGQADPLDRPALVAAVLRLRGLCASHLRQ